MQVIESHRLVTFANVGLWILLKQQLKPDTIYVTSVLHTLSKVGQNDCTNRELLHDDMICQHSRFMLNKGRGKCSGFCLTTRTVCTFEFE